MKTGKILLLVSLLLVLSLVSTSLVYPSEETDLRILYVGNPGSSREQDFVQFLEKHFKEVKTGDLKSFTGNQSTGFDVTILDYDGDGFKAPHPKLNRQYTRPTITVGVVGAFIGDSLNLKTGYL